MKKTLKITESQLKRILKENFEEMDPNMGSGERFDNPMRLIQSVSERLANAIKLKDWYLVKEVFNDVNHFGNQHVGGDDFSDSRESLTQNALDYNMNEEDLSEMGGPFHYDKSGNFTPGEEPEDLKLSRNEEKWEELLHRWSTETSDHDLNSFMEWLKVNVHLPRTQFDYSEKKSVEEMDSSPINESIQKIKSQFNRFM